MTPSLPPLPLASYFLRRPDWPWKATQDAATKLDLEGVWSPPVSGKHAFDTPPHGRPYDALDTPPRGRPISTTVSGPFGREQHNIISYIIGHTL